MVTGTGSIVQERLKYLD